MGKIKVPTPHIVQRLNRQKNESSVIKVDGISSGTDVDKFIIPDISVGGAETINIEAVLAQTGSLPINYSALLKFTDFEPMTDTKVVVRGDLDTFDGIYVVCDDSSGKYAASLISGLQSTEATTTIQATALAIDTAKDGECSFTISVDENGIPNFKGLNKEVNIPIESADTGGLVVEDFTSIFNTFYKNGAIANMGLKYDDVNFDFTVVGSGLQISANLTYPIRALEDTHMTFNFAKTKIAVYAASFIEVSNGANIIINDVDLDTLLEGAALNRIFSTDYSMFITKPTSLQFNSCTITANAIGETPERCYSTFDTHFTSCNIDIAGLENALFLRHKHIVTFNVCSLSAQNLGTPLFREPDTVGEGAKVFLVDCTVDTNLSLVGELGTNPNTMKHGVIEYVKRTSFEYSDIVLQSTVTETFGII